MGAYHASRGSAVVIEKKLAGDAEEVVEDCLRRGEKHLQRADVVARVAKTFHLVSAGALSKFLSLV